MRPEALNVPGAGEPGLSGIALVYRARYIYISKLYNQSRPQTRDLNRFSDLKHFSRPVREHPDPGGDSPENV